MLKVRAAVEQHVKSFLTIEVGLAFKDHRYLLAVSGGVDSMVMLEILSRLIPNQNLCIAHFNHNIRQLASDEDEKFVSQVSLQKRIRFISDRRPAHRSHSEESLRRDRLLFLNQAKDQMGCEWVVTGHQANDRLETFLMRLLRGTGLEGLKSIEPKNGFYLRPLLQCPRRSIDAYAKLHGVRFRQDETNLSARYLRNRLRHKVVAPFLNLTPLYGGEEKFFERLSDTFLDLKRAAVKEHFFAEDLFKSACSRTPYGIIFSWETFSNQPMDICQIIIRKVVSLLAEEKLSRSDAKVLIGRIKRREKSISAPFGITVQYSCGSILFCTKIHLQSHENFALLRSEEDWHIPHLGLRIGVDAELQRTSELRFFRPGDHYQGKKLKFYFAKEQVPRWERRFLPLLAQKNSSEVIWVYPRDLKGIVVRSAILNS